MPPKKSVRFNPAVAAAAGVSGSDDGKKDGRKRPAITTTTTGKTGSGSANFPIKKRRLNERPNEDEIDDVDDWVPDDDEDVVDPSLPSEREQLQAKRARRQKRQHGGTLDEDDMGDDDDDADNDMEHTLDDKSRSLATEGIAVEPFNMKSETNDGTGYFDGDTYVFRSNKDADEEPDAWLDSLNEDDKNKGKTLDGRDNKSEASDSSDTDDLTEKSSPKLSKEEWYTKILRLIGDKETIMQAVVRYGNLLKRTPLHNQHHHNHNKHNNNNMKKNSQSKHKQPQQQEEKTDKSNEQKEQDEKEATAAAQVAQKSLNDLTEAASALLNMGEVDIYQKTRQDLLKLLPNIETTTTTTIIASSSQQQQQYPGQEGAVAQSCYWEYKGNQDGQIHGPYTSEQMKAWIQAGYFVGTQAVQVRSVTTHTKPKKQPPKSKEENVKDLLSDLMDDDDDDDDKGEDDAPNKGAKDNEQEQEIVRGEWVSSEVANF